MNNLTRTTPTGAAALSTKRRGIPCGACGVWADEPAGSIPFYLKAGTTKTALWKCRHCGTYIRDADYDDPTIKGHFDITSYTNPSTEAHWRTLRTGLFKHVIDLASIHLGRTIQGVHALDLGTAFGILLELLREVGAKPEGVEIVPALRELARSRGLVIHEDLSKLPPQSFELISAIDSFYYMNDPHATLVRLKELITQDGILIMRLTNRTWYFNIARALGFAISPARFDDIKFNYSVKGAVRLLERSGYCVERIYWSDRGRGDIRPWAAIYYKVSPFLAKYLALRISPGMIVVARPTRASA